MAWPEFSIITPTYNGGAFIEEAIRSVRDQGYPAYEHIVVDAGSEDETDSVIGRYPNMVHIVEKGCTQSEALNIGFRRAKGDLLGWLNSDDAYAPGAFRRVAGHMEGHPEADMVYSDCSFVDEKGREVGLWKTAPFSYFRNLNYAQMVPCPSMFFRKRVLGKAGYINERFNYAMDYDFIVRISKCCRVGYIPGSPLAKFRVHSVSKTVGQRDRFEPEVREIRKMHGAVVPYFLAKSLQGAVGLFKKRI